MKKKLKALIGLMALCAAGTVGGAFALTRDGATGTGTAGGFDQAIYLYWGGTSTTASLADCDSLTTNVPVYRYLTVAPQSTKSVAGTVTVTFEMTPSEGDYHLNGVTVNVYRTDVEAITDANKGTYVGEGKEVLTLTSSHTSDTNTFTVSTGSGVHATPYYYAIEVTSVQGKTMGGEFKVSQAFAA